MDLSFPVDISIPSATPTPANADTVGRPFDDLLDDGLAQALAAAPGIVAVMAAAPRPDAQPLAGISETEALPPVATEQLTASPLAADVSTGDILGRAAAQALDLGLTSSPPSDDPVSLPDATTTGRDATEVTTRTARTDATDAAATATTGLSTPDPATTDPATTGPATTVALAGVAAAAAHGVSSPHGAGSTAQGAEAAGPTAATNQALALGSTAPRALDPARVALTRQNARSSEPSTASTSAPLIEVDGEIADAVSGSDTVTPHPTDTREGSEAAATPTEPAAVGADPGQRSGGSEGRHGSSDLASAGTDTFGSFATDKVRYLRDLAPAREIQRLAIDLDDARVAVRFADGAATVDVMSDPSSRLDSGWVSNVEKTLRQLDRPVDPSTPGEQSQDRRDHDDADSRRRETPDRDRPQPSIDDERVRRWQDATRSLMTTPNTRN